MPGIERFRSLIRRHVEELLVNQIAIIDIVTEPHERARGNRFVQEDRPRQCSAAAQTWQRRGVISDYLAGLEVHEFLTANLRPANYKDEVRTGLRNCIEAIDTVRIDRSENSCACRTGDVVEINEIRMSASRLKFESDNQLE